MYSAGVKRVRQDLSERADLITDNPAEREAIQRLNVPITERLAELGNGIEVRKRRGLLAGVKAVTYGISGEKRIGQIAAQIAEMRHTDDTLLSSGRDEAASTRRLKVVIVYGNALAILILPVKGLVIHWEIGKRNLAEENLQRANDQLERRTSELSETIIELGGRLFRGPQPARAAAPLCRILQCAGAGLRT